ncbi:MAG: tetratricopeptide repeat protein [Bacteroidales bacterium]|nr:tetratricopeptide repeat protein [Bacteroidales bacterium]
MQINLKFLKDSNRDIGKILFSGLSVVILIVMLLMSRDAGMSGDEHFHLDHARDVINFYRTFGQDTTAITVTLHHGASNLHMFGQLPDNIAFLIYDSFGIDDVMRIRHYVSTVFGWIAMLFAAMFAFRVSGRWRAAIITLLFAFLAPHLLGHSFNNLKDPPFAAMLMMGTYYLFYFFQVFPKVPWKVSTMLAVSIGCAIAIRAPGLLLIAYFGIFGFVYLATQWWQLYQKQKQKILMPKGFTPIFKRLLIYGLGISAAGFFLGCLLWPYALVNPWNVIEVFRNMSDWDVILRHVFEGYMIWSSHNPWYYLPKYVLITVPIVTLVSACLYPFFGGLKKENRFSTFILYFAIIFPIFWIVYTGANLYGGWRHALFLYPPLIAASGLFFDALIQTAKNKYQKIAYIALPFILLIGPAIHIVKNHPYQYVFFNRFVGGVPGAFGRFELDYYYHSTREASEWIMQNAQKTGLEATDRIRVVSWHSISVQYFMRHYTDRFDVGFSRWADRGNNDWDYAIFTITGMSPQMLRSDMFPPTNTVHQINVSGVPIAIILKRTDKSDYFGNRLLNEGQLDSALVLLKNSLALVPSSEAVIMNIADIYLRKNQNDSAIRYLDKLLAFDPRNEMASFFKAHALLRQNRLDEAQRSLQVIINHNPRNDAAPWLSAQIAAQQGNLILMERMVERTLIANANRQQEALDFMRQAYQSMGFSQNDATMAFTRIWIRVLENLGFHREARQLRNQR